MGRGSASAGPCGWSRHVGGAATAQGGRSRVLLLRGDAGIGKTTLVRWAIDEAADGITVLAATSVEAESALAFGGLADLVRPVIGLLDDLPVSQGDALRAAVAMGPVAEVEPFRIYAATLGLISAAAETAHSWPSSTTPNGSTAHLPRRCASWPAAWTLRGSCCSSRSGAESTRQSPTPVCPSSK